MLFRLDRDRPLVSQIVRALSRAIRAGELLPGRRLAATRTLAASHGIARNTVIAAYQQLLAEGYVETRRAGGTIVARDFPRARGRGARPATPAQSARIAGAPAAEHAPRAGGLSKEGRRLLRRSGVFAPLALRDRPGLRWDFQYNATVSDPTSRRAWSRIARARVRAHETHPPPWNPGRRVSRLHHVLARYLGRTRGVRATAEQILLVGSPQAAFRLAAQLLVDSGDVVLLEDPHYIGVRTTMLARGAIVRPVPVDERGLCTDLLSDDDRARLVYVTPSHQWPTGASLPYARRLELLAWARRARAWIVENDHNSETFYDGSAIEAIQGVDDSGRVIHVGTFSRFIEPYPVIAYAVLPPSLVGLFRAGSALDGNALPDVDKETLAEFIEEGEMERLLRRAARRLKAKRRVLLAALRTLPAPVEVNPTAGGLHVYAKLPGWTEEEVDRLVERAAEEGVGLYPGAPFFLQAPRTPGLLLGFARLAEKEIEEGVARLAKAMRAVLPRSMAPVASSGTG